MSNWKLAITILMGVSGLLTMAQEKMPTGTGNSSLKTNNLSGAEIYLTYCASCHGIDGKGTGLAAPALKKTPPDLTQISKRNGGQFPASLIARIIGGYEIEAVHGSRDMPIWGAYFRPAELLALTEHIRSIQQE